MKSTKILVHPKNITISVVLNWLLVSKRRNHCHWTHLGVVQLRNWDSWGIEWVWPFQRRLLCQPRMNLTSFEQWILCTRWVLSCSSGGSRGGARGGGGWAPLCFWTKLRPEGPKKTFFLDQSPPPYLRVWITVPPLIWRLCSTFRKAEYSRDGDDTSRTCSLAFGLDIPGALTLSAWWSDAVNYFIN